MKHKNSYLPGFDNKARRKRVKKSRRRKELLNTEYFLHNTKNDCINRSRNWKQGSFDSK